MFIKTFGVILRNGKIIDIIADSVEWSEKTRTFRFFKDSRSIARFNMDNVVGWTENDNLIPYIKSEVVNNE